MGGMNDCDELVNHRDEYEKMLGEASEKDRRLRAALPDDLRETARFSAKESRRRRRRYNGRDER